MSQIGQPDSSDAQAIASEAVPEVSLKSRAMRASGWIVVSYGLQQIIRLASSLIVTKLVMPEAYGLMAIVQVVMIGLEMFSDVGISACVVRDSRGDEPDFLNTAWTMQVARGMVLTIAACLMSWPMAWIYEEPRLMPLMLATSISAIINGLSSISIAWNTRHLAYGRLSVLEVTTQLCAVAVTIVWAYFSRNAWAMVGGAVAGALVRTVLSHTMLNASRPRLFIDPMAFRTIISFGKWILPSSILYFASQQLDRLLLGSYADMATLGIYSIAVMLIQAIASLNMQLSRRVIFPAIGRVMRDDASRVGQAYYRARHKLDLLFLPALGLLLVAGHRIVDVLFDYRFAAAGWMFQLLALRCAMRCVLEPSECCLVAIGDTRPTIIQNITRLIWVVVGMPLGWKVGGIAGLVWIAALSEVLIIPILWYPMRRHGILNLRKEAVACLTLVAGMGVGIALEWALPVRTHWPFGFFNR